MKKFFKLSTIMLTLLLSVFLLVSCDKAKDVVTEEETQPKVEEVIIQEKGSVQETVSADTLNTIKNLLKGYMNGSKQYTKLTTLQSANIAALNGVYHGGASTSQRRTYYDETVDALLMCDYDGTFEHINSGYRTDTENARMYHWSYTGETNGKGLTNLTSDINNGWYVSGYSVSSYYDVLSELGDAVTAQTSVSKWEANNGVYTYTTDCAAGYLTNTDPYNDGFLKLFQWFAAPMLKVNESLQIAKVQIFEAKGTVDGVANSNVLVIKILTTNDVVLSTAYVVPGLVTGAVEVDKVKLSSGSIWDSMDGDERYAAWLYKTGDGGNGQWLSMVGSDGLYEAELPIGYSHGVNFGRMNPNANNSFDDGHCWNQTADATVQTNGTYYLTAYQTDNKYEGLWENPLDLVFLYVYFDHWSTDARFAGYCWADGQGNQWYDFVHFVGKYYYIKPSSNYDKVIFCRMNKDNSTNSFTHSNNGGPL